MKFLFVFNQTHLDFRIAEFLGICRIFDIEFDPGQLNTKEHVFILEFPDSSPVEKILSRSVIVKFVCELLFEPTSLDNLFQIFEESQFDSPDLSFKCKFLSVNRQQGIDYLNRERLIADKIPFDVCNVDLKTPDNTFCAIEVYKNNDSEVPERIFFGKMIAEGQQKLKRIYNLKDRLYIGNTTMDPELSFIQANIAGIKSGDLVLDPFSGTGGLLIPAAHFGAYVIGAEINYSIAKAIGKSSRHGVKYRNDEESVEGNFEQYGLSDQYLSTILADASIHGVYRPGPIFDRIVSDPPYGVREKSSKCGRKEPKPDWIIKKDQYVQSYPEKTVYELSNTFTDLLNLAASKLVIDGCLSFWYPIVVQTYSEKSLPQHPALKLIFNCLQPLTTKTSRRLLTYKKIREPNSGESGYIPEDMLSNGVFRQQTYGK
ncbi:hypothetical protein WR25_13677 [Diploscapter pachys]|uniref:tRNA (guanine(10)-N(2))-methyltransferase TRMT11 n=1 Tax=Diploscapter pachys TaxID=2018661 RepID=A0A2A2LF17_9BILA|nr:hypothetical protein WR25_13677 [Diploscapter pachys]